MAIWSSHFSYFNFLCSNDADQLKSSVANPDPNPDPDPSDPYVFGILDPDPDPLVRGMDPDPSITKQK